MTNNVHVILIFLDKSGDLIFLYDISNMQCQAADDYLS